MQAQRRLTVTRDVRVPFSIAHQYAEDFFRQAERGISVHVPLRDLVPHLSGRLRQPVQMVFARHRDDQELGRPHDALSVEWRAGTRLLPDFHGTLRLRIVDVDTSRLTLEGSYHAPFGRLGRLFDLVLGHRIAWVTMRDLLRRLADAMEADEAAYRAANTAARD